MTKTSFGLDNCRVSRGPVKDHDAITLDLPFPPSVNNLFANSSAGRFTTQQYRDWQTAAAWRLLADKPGRVPGPVKITLVYEEKNGRRDLDNLLKAVLDLLVKHNVIDGDHRTVLREISAKWSANVQGVRITITPAVKVERAA
jgi:Holliday junction resolvase RusA-like endonuclease